MNMWGMRSVKVLVLGLIMCSTAMAAAPNGQRIVYQRLPGAPGSEVVDSAGRHLYLLTVNADPGTVTLLAFSTITGQLLASFSMGHVSLDTPPPLLIDTRAHRLIAINYDANRMLVLDTLHNSVVARRHAPLNAAFGAVDLSTHRILLAGSTSGAAMIDARDGRIVARLLMQQSPAALADDEPDGIFIASAIVSGAGTAIGIDARTGQQHWSAPLIGTTTMLTVDMHHVLANVCDMYAVPYFFSGSGGACELVILDARTGLRIHVSSLQFSASTVLLDAARHRALIQGNLGLAVVDMRNGQIMWSAYAMTQMASTIIDPQTGLIWSLDLAGKRLLRVAFTGPRAHVSTTRLPLQHNFLSLAAALDSSRHRLYIVGAQDRTGLLLQADTRNGRVEEPTHLAAIASDVVVDPATRRFILTFPTTPAVSTSPLMAARDTLAHLAAQLAPRLCCGTGAWININANGSGDDQAGSLGFVNTVP